MRFANPTFITAMALAILLGVVAIPLAQAQTFTLLHTFSGVPDGAGPSGLIRDAAGNLYGTTSGGGNKCGYQGRSTCGTVFRLDPAGTETVLYRFTAGTDGSNPAAGLVMDAAGNLYGTTTSSASAGKGTIFKLDTAGTLTVLHSVGSHAGLVMDAAGNLYGSTAEGIFKLDSTGTFTVLDANARSEAALTLDAAGNLYGTTEFGGNTGGVCGTAGCGTVFKLDTAGSYTVLYSFTGAGYDGLNPLGGVVLDAAGNLWGATSGGGALDCGAPNKPKVGCGTVFKVSTAGGETSALSLNGPLYPAGGLALDAAGSFYGTSKYYGSPEGLGSVFEIGPDGIQNLVHTFNGFPDGQSLLAGVVLDPAGNIYGTTSTGGPLGVGTIFKSTPTGPQNFPLALVIYGTGTVTGNGVDCSSNCATWVSSGTSFTLTATPPTNGSFVGWVPPTCSGSGTCSVTVSSAQTLGATFDSDFSISATALTPVSVSAGGSATSTISVVAAANGFFSSVTLTCAVTPTPALAPTCSIVPSSVMPGASATLAVSTTAPTQPQRASTGGSGLLFAVCLPLIGLMVTRVSFGSDLKSRKGPVAAVVLVSMLIAALVSQTGCGGSTHGSPGTPPGTYNITVTGTYSTGALVHNTPTMLSVQ